MKTRLGARLSLPHLYRLTVMSGGHLGWLQAGEVHAQAEHEWLGARRLQLLLATFGGEIAAISPPGDNAKKGAREQYNAPAFRAISRKTLDLETERQRGLLGTWLGPNAYGKDW